VITNWRRCRGKEFDAHLPCETTRSSFDDRQMYGHIFGCNHLYGDSMKDGLSGDSIVLKSISDSTGYEMNKRYAFCNFSIISQLPSSST
jgi:hypothetical protein